MALQIRSRYKPLVNRDPQQTLLENFDPANGSGTLVLPVQIVVYDDATFNPTTAKPGDPADEAWLGVLAEDVIRLDVAALAGKTQAEITAAMTTALDDWAATVKPLTAGLAKLARAARSVGYRPLP